MARIEQDELGEMLSAYLDGELSAAEVQVVERLLREDATARHLLEELRRTVQATASLPRHPAPASLLADVQATLERAALLDDMPQAPVRSHHQHAPWTARLSMAAMLGLVVIGGWWFLQDPSRRGSTPLEERQARTVQGSAPADQSVGAKRTIAARPVPAPAESPPPAALASKSDDRLTVDQKLAAGVELAALQSHAFAAESVRLQLAVRDPGERDALARRVAERLADERLADLAAEKSGGSASAGKSRGFYYRGSSGTNFEAAGESQILVRATPRQIDRVLDDLVQSGQADASATLVAGTLSVQGLQKTQAVVGLLGQSQVGKSKEPRVFGDRAAMKTTNGGGASGSSNDLVEGLLRIIGVDPQLVESPEPSVSAPPVGGERVAGAATPTAEIADHPAEAAAKTEEKARAGERVRREARPAPADAPLVDRRVTALEKAARESGSAVDEEPLVTLIIQVVPSAKTHLPLPPKPAEPSKSGAK